MTDFIDVLRAEKIAQDRMFANPDWDKSFMLFVEGKVPTACVWLDPYMGAFQLFGQESKGFMLTRDLPETAKIVLPGI